MFRGLIMRKNDAADYVFMTMIAFILGTGLFGASTCAYRVATTNYKTVCVDGFLYACYSDAKECEGMKARCDIKNKYNYGAEENE
jgi:hypothetical protein